MKTFMENFKIARILTKKALKKEGFVKYYIYYFMHIIFSLGFFLSPFLVSKWKLASEIKEENNISITGLFEPVSGKGYFHLLVANVIKFAIFLGVFLLISLIGALLFFLGYGIAFFDNGRINFLIPILFTIPAALFLLVLILGLPFINVPNSYVVNNYPALTPGRILKYSFYSMKNGGKILMLKTLLFEYVTKVLYLAIAIGLPILLLNVIKGYVGVGLMFVLISIFLAIYLYIGPIISLISLLIRSNIYDEVVFVKNSNKLTEININNEDIVINNNSKQETLNSLFKIEKKIDSTPSYQNTLSDLNKEEAKKKKVAEPEIIENNVDEIEEIKEEKIVQQETNYNSNINNDIVHNEYKNSILDDDKNELEKLKEEKFDEEIELVEEKNEQEEIIEDVKDDVKEIDSNIHQEESTDINENVDEEIELVEEKIEDNQEVESSNIESSNEQEEDEIELVELEEIVDGKEESTLTNDKVDEEIELVEETKNEEILDDQQEEIITKEEDNPQNEDELEEYLNNIPEKEENKKENENDDELNAFLDSIPEKETTPEKSTKRGRKKKGE